MAGVESLFHAVHATPFGRVGIRLFAGEVSEFVFLPPSARLVQPVEPLAARACRQIDAYVRNPRHEFDLPLRPRGTSFQQRVWSRIAAIPSGSTRRYGELALDLKSAPRAVGQACGANPLPLIVPCHRVVSATGMGGFANATDGYLPAIKRWLLAHEAT